MNSPISTLATFAFYSDPENVSATFLRNFYQVARAREMIALSKQSLTVTLPYMLIPWHKEEVAIKSFTNSAAVIDERVLLDDCRSPLQLLSWHEKKILWPLLCMLVSPFDPSSVEELILLLPVGPDPAGSLLLENMLTDRLSLLTTYMQTGSWGAV